jgi:predicted RNase H-like HicB family nuclease
MQFTGIIKKSGDCYVALCLELNIASQGDSIEESKNMLQEACEEYLSYMKENGLENEIRPVPFDLLREFLIGDVDYVKPSREWKYSESITFMVSASV